MPVSEEMVDGVIYGVPHSNSRQKAQAVINSAWTDFDPDNESTWPKEKEWLVELNDGAFMFLHWDGGYHWEDVIRYADFEHFRYEGE